MPIFFSYLPLLRSFFSSRSELWILRMFISPLFSIASSPSLLCSFTPRIALFLIAPPYDFFFFFFLFIRNILWIFIRDFYAWLPMTFIHSFRQIVELSYRLREKNFRRHALPISFLVLAFYFSYTPAFSLIRNISPYFELYREFLPYLFFFFLTLFFCFFFLSSFPHPFFLLHLPSLIILTFFSPFFFFLSFVFPPLFFFSSRFFLPPLPPLSFFFFFRTTKIFLPTRFCHDFSSHTSNSFFFSRRQLGGFFLSPFLCALKT